MLVNCSEPKPILFTDGAKYVETYIKKYNTNNRTFDADLDIILRKHNIIVNSETDKIKPSPRNKKSIALYLLTNQSCNLGCVYCLAGKKNYNTGNKMPFHIAIDAIKKAAREITMNDTLQIIFFGGEPLLNPNIIHKITKYVDEHVRIQFPKINFHYHITTNLTRLSLKDIRLFKKYNFSVLVDLDGRRIEHDKTRKYLNSISSFEDTYLNIKKLAKENINFAVRATVTSYNVDKLIDIYEFFSNNKYTYQGYPMLIPINSDGDILPKYMYPDVIKYRNFIREKLINSIKDEIYLSPMVEVLESIVFNYKQHYGCGMAIGNTYVVDANGDVFPCIYLVGNSNYLIGNVKNSNMSFEFSMPELIVDEIEGCNNCKYRYFCGSGCLICELLLKKVDSDAYQYFRRVTCEIFKESFLEICWALCERKISMRKPPDNFFHSDKFKI